MRKSVQILLVSLLFALLGGGGCQNWNGKWTRTVDFSKAQIPGTWQENDWKNDKNPVRAIGGGKYEFVFTVKNDCTKCECKILTTNDWDKPGFNGGPLQVGSEVTLTLGDKCQNNIEIKSATAGKKYKMTFTVEGIKLKVKVEEVS